MAKIKHGFSGQRLIVYPFYVIKCNSYGRLASPRQFQSHLPSCHTGMKPISPYTNIRIEFIKRQQTFYSRDRILIWNHRMQSTIELSIIPLRINIAHRLFGNNRIIQITLHYRNKQTCENQNKPSCYPSKYLYTFIHIRHNNPIIHSAKAP